MKLGSFLFLILISDSNVFPDLNKVRSLFNEALNCKQGATDLIEYLDQSKINSISIGYKGAAKMLLSKYSYNPFSKYKYFSEGSSLLEKSISMDTFSVELRYLRFIFQTNSPSFLGYNHSIENDKLFLLNTVQCIDDTYLKELIIKQLKQSDFLSYKEKMNL